MLRRIKMEPAVEQVPVPAVEPVQPPSEQVPETAPETVESPSKRGRGRPPGAKNKPKVRVVPLEPEPPEEPVAPEEPVVPDAPKPKRVRVQPPQPKLLVVPQPPPATPHETFRMAIAALGQVAQADRASKQAYFDGLVARMVK
jgi:hypothetical protein